MIPIPLLPVLLLPLQGPALDLTFQPSGIVEKVGGYAPYGFKATAEKPAVLIQAPEAAAPLYGSLKIGGREFLVLIDGGKKFYVDSNANGDLTDDPAPIWEEKTYKTSQREAKSYSGFATVDLVYGGKTYPSRVGLYATPKADEFGYYADFALAGKVTLGEKSYDAILADSTLAFDPADAKGNALLLIDKDGSGTYHPGFEFNPIREPFNVGGTTYEVKREGAGLALIKSAKTVKERTADDAPADPNLANGLRPGKAALSFKAQTTGGKAIAFPQSYKGKLVLIDFWATWCGPCMREVPNLAATYAKYRSQGFEVLGISLDEPDSAAKIRDVTAKNGMTWDQIYDGKGWQAALAKQYGIKAIPATYLVDGTTGKIVAFGDDLRGEKLAATVAKALAEKR